METRRRGASAALVRRSESMSTQQIRVGIAGYGNLGRGVEASIAQSPDMKLVGVFTRRAPETLQILSPHVPVRSFSELPSLRDEIDVLILCGGSHKDLPVQGPELAAYFNTVDSFDTHAKIPEYFAALDEVAQRSGKVALLAVGWDPGMFSLNRLFGEAILPVGETYTFWGRGLSQGHSDAVRRVPGVKHGVQYTIPSEDAMARVRAGENPTLSTREKHQRQVFVVLHEGADAAQVERDIVTMPNYFADYDTSVNVISEEVMAAEHSAMPHGGFVIRSGTTGQGHHQVNEYAIKLGSNPEFTASVLVAYARAVFRLSQKGTKGAHTVFDVPPGLLSPKSPEALRKELL